VSSRTFTKQELLDILFDEDDDDETKILIDKPTSNSRWSIHHRFVFKKDGKLYETNYSKGATEQQDESPWEHEPEVECIEVVEYEKVVIDYKPRVE